MAALQLMENTVGLKESWHFGDCVFTFEKESTLIAQLQSCCLVWGYIWHWKKRYGWFLSQQDNSCTSQSGLPSQKGTGWEAKTSFPGAFLTRISNRSGEHNYFFCSLLDCFLCSFFFPKIHNLKTSKNMMLSTVQRHHSTSRNLWSPLECLSFHKQYPHLALQVSMIRQ